MQNSANFERQVHAEYRISSSQSFFAQTMLYFMLALGSCALGIWGGISLLPRALIANSGFLLLMSAVTLILVFTARKWSIGKSAYLFLIIFAAICGITLIPLLFYASLSGGIEILGKALLASISMFGGFALYGITTKKNLAGWRGFLTGSLIGMVLVSVISLILHLIGFQVWTNEIELIFSGFGILVFSGFTAYDFQKIMREKTNISPVQASISLFLDFILLFEYILRLMLGMNRD